jgi:Asp/Glu/hydantoin racemase
MLTRLAATLGHAGSLAGVVTLAVDGGQIAANPDAALAALQSAVEQAVERYAAQAVIIGGAGLAGLAARLQPDAPVPLIDSVLAGARRAGVLARDYASAAAPAAGTRTPVDRVATRGLGQNLAKLLG